MDSRRQIYIIWDKKCIGPRLVERVFWMDFILRGTGTGHKYIFANSINHIL